MKKVLASLLACLCLMTNVYAVNVSTEKIDEPYEYPVLPGTVQWQEMTKEERYASCYVERAIAENMTTEALLQTVLDYPYYDNVYAYNSFAEGLMYVSEYCPPLQVLLERDATMATIESYVSDVTVMDILYDGKNGFNHNQFDAQALLKYLSLCKESAGDNDNSVRSVSTYVYTPRGTAVSVVQNYGWPEISNISGVQLNATAAAAKNQEYLALYPGVTLLRDSSPKYNCHSYAWYSTSSSNNCWMDDPYAYISDGSYVSATSLVAGNRITYKRSGTNVIIHSGIMNTANGLEISKWGPFGLFKHEIDNCPYSPSNPVNSNLGSITINQWRAS